MDQRITLKIAGKEYSLNASSPEMERMMRLAAKDVNEMLINYDSRFPQTDLTDKFAFTALQEAVGKFYFKSQLAMVGEEAKTLSSEIDSYLEGTIEK